MPFKPNYHYANLARAGFMQRLGAASYDALLAMAIYAFAGILGFAGITVAAKWGWLFNGVADDIAVSLQQSTIVHGCYQLWLLCCVVAFYSYFWSRTGQTLGMKAWHLRVQHPNGQNLSLITATARCCWSLLGLGNLLILLNNSSLALQDRMTQSEVVVVERVIKKAEH